MREGGGVAIVLHAHLPFVLNHGRWPHGSDWLCEACAETYIPLLVMMRSLERDRVPFRLNLGLTPILCEQLASEAFRAEFRNYLEQKTSVARENERDFMNVGRHELAALARQWTGFYQSVRHEFDAVWRGRLLESFEHFARSGSLELMTGAATHAYLPLVGRDSAMTGQMRTARAAHERHFGEAARGTWLPECGYRPRGIWEPPVGPPWPPVSRRGVDEFAAENGVKFFIVDTHLIRGGRPAGEYLLRFAAVPAGPGTGAASTRPLTPERRVHAPYWVASDPRGSGPVAVMARDPDASTVVWSGELGYPGDGCYLEFHKKHHPGGLRYWRVTSRSTDLGAKEPYDLEKVGSRVEDNADHFVTLVRESLVSSRRVGGTRAPILTAPFDAELFGHWWFEGVRWLELVLRKLAEAREVETVRLGDYLEDNPPDEYVSLPEGSWGEGGMHGIWLNEGTEWLWRDIYAAEERMEHLAGELVRMERTGSALSPQTREVLAQAARSLMLMESSDWPFLISTAGAPDYASARFKRHLDDFGLLAGMATSLANGIPLSPADIAALRHLQQRDFVFRDLDPTWWSP